MLAMAHDGLENDNLLWDDQSWEFPNLGGGDQEDCGNKLVVDMSNKATDGPQVAKDEEAPPPPQAPAKGKKRRAATKAGDGGGESDDHELHIWTERERRKKMRNMFSSLHALLPHLQPKADKSTIVDEAVNHIKKLQQTLENLQKQKLERFHSQYGLTNIINPINFDPSIIPQQNLVIQSREAFLAEQGSMMISNSAVTLPNLNTLFPVSEFPTIFKTWTSPNVILNVSGIDAHINICCIKKPGLLTAICFVMEKHKLEVVSAQVSSGRNRCMYMIHAHANGASDQYLQAFPVDEIYKQVAAEIMMWVNS